MLGLNFKFLSGKLTQSINTTRNDSYNNTGGTPLKLASTSYSLGTATAFNPNETTKFSLNLNYSASVRNFENPSIFPGNLSVSFQFSKALKDDEKEK